MESEIIIFGECYLNLLNLQKVTRMKSICGGTMNTLIHLYTSSQC